MPTKQQNHDYYIRNKEKILARNKEYARENRERFRESSNQRRRKWSQTWKGIYNTLKQNAKRRGVFFDLTQDQMEAMYEVHPRECIYCLVPESMLPKSFKEVCGRIVNRLSIDRVEPKLGYTLSNLCFSCYRCNAIKSDFFTFEEMLYIGRYYVKPKWEAECV